MDRSMTGFRLFLVTAAAGIVFTRPCACQDGALSIVPMPAEWSSSKGGFKLTPTTPFVHPEGNSAASAISSMCAEKIHQLLGFPVRIISSASRREPLKSVFFELDPGVKNGEEAYTLSVTPDSVRIRASGEAGLFYGMQTFLQLLPTSDYRSGDGQKAICVSLPCVRIHDFPRFRWRGMHLDVSRHFFPKEDVKKAIDLLAMHKMNIFHWHLTDDQGWRIEIAKYPLLTQKGAWREGTGQEPWDYFVGPAVEGKPRYGGFYTRDDIREVVAHARQRYVTLVPEIEMPGHSRAALDAYPGLSCSGRPYLKPDDVPFEFTDPYCAGNEETFVFLENVLDEIIDLFPGETIHIGGDEAKKTPWEKCPRCLGRMRSENLKTAEELQSYFIRRIAKFLISRNRKPIGWDEILEGGLASKTAVMSWRGEEGGIEAARQGHDVVMTPSGITYFSSPQSDPFGNMEAAENIATLRRVYEYDPVPAELSAREARRILGAQACLWSENLKSFSQAQVQLLPRLCALAETVWTPRRSKEWNDFQRRMQDHYARLDRTGAEYFIPPPSGVKPVNVFIRDATVEMAVDLPGGRIVYTTDGTDPTARSAIYGGPIRASENLVLKARTFLPSGKCSDIRTGVFTRQIPRRALEAEPHPRPGLTCRLFSGGISTLDDFSNLAFDRAFTVGNFVLPEDRPSDRFGLEFTGFIRVPAEGVYTFFTNSDDGSRLFIGEALLADNDGVHGERVIEGSIALAAGRHPIRVLFFEDRFGEALKVGYEGPGIGRMEIPDSVLTH